MNGGDEGAREVALVQRPGDGGETFLEPRDIDINSAGTDEMADFWL
jgi:hypothetical protein